MADSDEKLHTLTEVSKRTDISMPTLQRYKKLHQGRIPSVGKGRKQRYPEEALDVFREIKEENLSRRGRPRKSRAARKKTASTRSSGRRRTSTAKAAKASSSSSDDLLTLVEIEKRTGISYPTLLRYTKKHLDQIPHEGKGRRRRYKPEAVEVFKDLRSKSRRGRRAKSATSESKPKAKRTPRSKAASSGDTGNLAGRLRDLEKSHQSLEKLLRRIEQKLDKPMTVTLKR